jgi:hypothetical protein
VVALLERAKLLTIPRRISGRIFLKKLFQVGKPGLIFFAGCLFMSSYGLGMISLLEILGAGWVTFDPAAGGGLLMTFIDVPRSQ